MPAQPGQMLSHYRLVAKIGEGGMGVVWKAFDTTLDREVAIKTLPEELAGDSERLGRFKREAKAVAALNHPSIVTVHSVEEVEGVHFITMELVRGKSLTELIPRDGLPLGKFFDQAVALADAISTAHQQGITHRDLKPDNVMIGDDGRLKVLDFGIAKLREEGRADHGTQLPTATVTQEGKILGTVSYMSPEQAEGKQVDHRSDIFSLGVILYQMATGQRPFKGDTSISIISSIMKDTPPSITELNQILPRHLGRIIKQCLQKDPDLRCQTAKDLRNQLAELRREVDSGEALPAGVGSGSGSRKRSAFFVGLAAIAVVIVVTGYFLIEQRRGSRGVESASINPVFTQLTSQPGQELFPSLSPDGEFVVYSSQASGNSDIYLQRVGGEKAINLTENSPENDYQPSFSPDGDLIAFRSERDGGGIFVMGATGEFVRRLTDFGFNPSWSPDGRAILIATESVLDPRNRIIVSGIWAIDVNSGTKRQISEGDAVQPSWSPHGHRIAYWGIPSGTGQRDIWTLPAAGGETVRVTDDAAIDSNPVWSADGRYLYFCSDRGGSMNLWRVAIDEETGRVLGESHPVTTPSTCTLQLSTSRDGRHIAYAAMSYSGNMWRAGFDPLSGEALGEPVSVTSGSETVSSFHSPDGKWIVFTTQGMQENLFIIRADGTDRRQLTNDTYKNRMPRWSPDRNRIAFVSNRSGSYEIWTIEPDASGLRQLTDTPDGVATNPIWSPDGSQFLFARHPQKVILIADSSMPFEEQTLKELPSVDEARDIIEVSSWSPDGQRLAGFGIHQDGTPAGLFEHSLRRGSWKRLLDFGFAPVWLHDSRRLLFLDEGKIFLLDTVSEDYREILRLEPPLEMGTFEIAPDNQTIYFTSVVEESDIWMLTLE